MHKHIATVRAYFAKLGLEPEIADLYLALHTHGPQSMSELSRSSGVERTRIYRLVDSLLDSNLIELEAHGRRGVMKAAPIANLTILIKKREEELHSLQDELGLIEQVLGRNSLSAPGLRLQLFQGVDGIEDLLQRQIQGTHEQRLLLHESLPRHTGTDFWKRWLQLPTGMTGRMISNQKSATGLPDPWQSAIIAPAVCTIRHTTALYGDVTAYFIEKDGNFFGLEIHSPEVTATQQQLFELLWQTTLQA